MPDTKPSACQRQCWPTGSEVLPEGIVAKTSNLEMRPLWDSAIKNRISKRPSNLLAIAVGVKQKEIVNRIVEKVRMQSYNEMKVFEKRWREAAEMDKCWIDPYQQQQQLNQTSL
ncbi:unnamed protein product [Lupinus luteus]|uniref:Uncharacterized protein n=1 Tax=Lupinus luteus TaxID=3873 RepID=A0AAV1VV76_LUPLU